MTTSHDTDVLVRCEDVSRSFGTGAASIGAVRSVTCELCAGQRVAITGPSGSGKSTLLHLMGGLDEPTSGRITWPALGSAATLRPGPVAVVFQGAALLPALDAVENVGLPLVLAGVPMDEAQDRARAALALLGLEEVADRLPDELSGGQVQRVAVCRALAGGSRLLLADEPTGQLDAASAERVVDALLAAASGTGTALVLTTHDPNVAARLPERWEMHHGLLTQRSSATAG